MTSETLTPQPAPAALLRTCSASKAALTKGMGGENGIAPSAVAEALLHGLENEVYEIRVGRTEEVHRHSLSSPEDAFLANIKAPFFQCFILSECDPRLGKIFYMPLESKEKQINFILPLVRSKYLKVLLVNICICVNIDLVEFNVQHYLMPIKGNAYTAVKHYI